MPIRKLHHSERARFAAHLKRLDSSDRRSRFVQAFVSDERIDAYVAGIKDDDVVLGAFDDDRMVGGTHVAFGVDSAEIGVSVEAAHRSQGLGGRLFAAAAQLARNRQIAKLYTFCLADNQAVAAMARRHGMAIRRECDEAEAFVTLAPPDLITVSAELSADFLTALHDWEEGLRQSCRGIWPART